MRDGRAQAGAQPVAAPDHLQPYALLHAAWRFVFQVSRHQAHERIYFGCRTLPVVARERKEGEDADTCIGRRLHHAAGGFDPGAMAQDARQSARGRPAAIAIHDDPGM